MPKLFLPYIKEKRLANGQFCQGHKAWNKGKKFKNFGGVKTQFKVGNIPFNTKFDGAISCRHHKRDNKNYYYIRIKKGKWKLKYAESVISFLPTVFSRSFEDLVEKSYKQFKNQEML